MAAPYYGPPQPGYAPQPMRPPEADSIKSMANIASIFGILFSLLFLVIAIYQFWLYMTWEAVNDVYDDIYGFDDAVRIYFLVYAIIVLLMFIFGIVFFLQCRKIGHLVDQGQYQQAKSKALTWTIIGFLFVGVIPGIILLIAYLKFDNLIRSTQMGPQPGYGAQPYGQYPPPPPVYQQPPPQPAYQQAPPPGEMRVCMGCGRQVPIAYNVCPHCGKPRQ